VYNMIRLADYLFRWTGDATYADYIERNSTTDPGPTASVTGMVSYFLPLSAGARKLWGTPTCDFWCCHGTLVQAHTVTTPGSTTRRTANWRSVSTFPRSSKRAWGQRGARRTDAEPAGRRQPASAAGVTVALRVTCEPAAEFELRLRLRRGWPAGQPFR